MFWPHTLYLVLYAPLTFTIKNCAAHIRAYCTAQQCTPTVWGFQGTNTGKHIVCSKENLVSVFTGNTAVWPLWNPYPCGRGSLLPYLASDIKLPSVKDRTKQCWMCERKNHNLEINMGSKTHDGMESDIRRTDKAVCEESVLCNEMYLC